MKRTYFIFSFACIGILFLQCSRKPRENKVESMTLLLDPGGRVSWSADGTKIAYDKEGSDGYYDVYVADADGSNEVCLTCDATGGAPQKHNGTPEFHPDGEYIVFTGEKDVHEGGSTFAGPGQGVYNDLYLVEIATNEVWALTNLPGDGKDGVLHPHFSKDGNRLSWSQQYDKARPKVPAEQFGADYLIVADFDFSGAEPQLLNSVQYEPGGKAFYENHGFSNDGTKLLFMSTYEAEKLLRSELYTFDLTTASTTKLTEGGYNEHAQYSPNGTKIVWMSNNYQRKGTDWFMMDAEGGNVERVTDIKRQRNEYGLPRSKKYTCADFSFNPEGDRMIGFIITSSITHNGFTVIIDLEDY